MCNNVLQNHKWHTVISSHPDRYLFKLVLLLDILSVGCRRFISEAHYHRLSQIMLGG